MLRTLIAVLFAASVAVAAPPDLPKDRTAGEL
jgi:hypothetical protein